MSQSTKPFDCVSTLTDAIAPTFYNLVPRCPTMASIEDQLAELKQQVVEERESRAAAEKAAADRAEAQQKRHEETLKKQHVETMQMFFSAYGEADRTRGAEAAG